MTPATRRSGVERESATARAPRARAPDPGSGNGRALPIPLIGASIAKTGASPWRQLDRVGASSRSDDALARGPIEDDPMTRSPLRRPARRRRGRLGAVALDTLTLAWITRGMWRLSRGRFPWRAR